jgi:hypothetical protein
LVNSTIAKTFRPVRVDIPNLPIANVVSPIAQQAATHAVSQKIAATVNQLSSNTLETFSSITSNPLLSGKLLGPLTFVSGVAQTVSHGLGKNYLSWFVGSPNDYVRIKENKSPDRSKYIVLETDGNVVLMIYAI